MFFKHSYANYKSKIGLWNNETIEYRKLIEVMWINKKKYFSNAFLEIFRFIFQWTSDFPCGSAGKESTCNEGDLGLIPGLRRFLGGGKGHPLQYSGLENSMDCIVHRVTESDTTEWLSLYLLKLIKSLALSWNLNKYECAKMLTFPLLCLYPHFTLSKLYIVWS